MRVTCPRCGYTWEYRGRRMRVSCPGCGYTFRLQRSSGSGNVSVAVLDNYDCFLSVLREHGVEVVDGGHGADSVAIPESIAERLWRSLVSKCGVR